MIFLKDRFTIEIRQYKREMKDGEFMKRSNGEGSITVLKGKNRKKRNWARVFDGYIYDEKKDKLIPKQKSLGVFRTKGEAQKAIDEYFTNPYQFLNRNMTLDEAFQTYYDTVYETSPSYAKDLKYKWRYCDQIKDLKISETLSVHMKRFLEGEPYYIDPSSGKKKVASPNTILRIKSLLNQIFDLAISESVITVNQARNFKTPKEAARKYERNKKHHIPFSIDEQLTLKENLDYPFVDMIYIQIFMGWRPDELVEILLEDVYLEDQYIIGGKKTDSGYRRIVPIHPEIMEYIKNYYEEAQKIGSRFLFNDIYMKRHSTNKQNLSYSNYRYRFQKVIKALNLNEAHTPHDARVTFATIAKISGMDAFAVKKFMGHSLKNDITEESYTAPDFSWFQNQMEKFQYAGGK